MHFNDFVKKVISELKVMTAGNSESFFTFYHLDNGNLVSCTRKCSMTFNGDVSCVFKIHNFNDDNFEVVLNEGCGDILLEDFESQPCCEDAAIAVATKIYEVTMDM